MYFSNFPMKLVPTNWPVTSITFIFVSFLLVSSFADLQEDSHANELPQKDVFELDSVDRFVRAEDKATHAPQPGLATEDPEKSKAADEARRAEKRKMKKADLDKWRDERLEAKNHPHTDALQSYTYEWAGTLKHGDECRSKEEIQKTQAGRADMSKDDKSQFIGENSCDIKKFLTCIVPKNKTVEEGELYDKYAGTCECHPAVGGKDGILGTDGTCRIPANQGINSDCGGHKAALQTYQGEWLPTSCAEGAECLPGDLFTGQRCQCKIGYEGEKGKCSSGWRLVSSTPLAILTALGLASLLTFVPETSHLKQI